jgi:hypothetical protein
MRTTEHRTLRRVHDRRPGLGVHQGLPDLRASLRGRPPRGAPASRPTARPPNRSGSFSTSSTGPTTGSRRPARSSVEDYIDDASSNRRLRPGSAADAAPAQQEEPRRGALDPAAPRPPRGARDRAEGRDLHLARRDARRAHEDPADVDRRPRGQVGMHRNTLYDWLTKGVPAHHGTQPPAPGRDREGPPGRAGHADAAREGPAPARREPPPTTTGPS